MGNNSTPSGIANDDDLRKAYSSDEGRDQEATGSKQWMTPREVVICELVRSGSSRDEAEKVLEKDIWQDPEERITYSAELIRKVERSGWSLKKDPSGQVIWKLTGLVFRLEKCKCQHEEAVVWAAEEHISERKAEDAWNRRVLAEGKTRVKGVGRTLAAGGVTFFDYVSDLAVVFLWMGERRDAMFDKGQGWIGPTAIGFVTLSVLVGMFLVLEFSEQSYNLFSLRMPSKKQLQWLLLILLLPLLNLHVLFMGVVAGRSVSWRDHMRKKVIFLVAKAAETVFESVPLSVMMVADMVTSSGDPAAFLVTVSSLGLSVLSMAYGLAAVAVEIHQLRGMRKTVETYALMLLDVVWILSANGMCLAATGLGLWRFFTPIIVLGAQYAAVPISVMMVQSEKAVGEMGGCVKYCLGCSKECQNSCRDCGKKCQEYGKACQSCCREYGEKCQNGRQNCGECISNKRETGKCCKESLLCSSAFLLGPFALVFVAFPFIFFDAAYFHRENEFFHARLIVLRRINLLLLSVLAITYLESEQSVSAWLWWCLGVIAVLHTWLSFRYYLNTCFIKFDGWKIKILNEDEQTVEKQRPDTSAEMQCWGFWRRKANGRVAAESVQPIESIPRVGGRRHRVEGLAGLDSAFFVMPEEVWEERLVCEFVDVSEAVLRLREKGTGGKRKKFGGVGQRAEEAVKMLVGEVTKSMVLWANSGPGGANEDSGCAIAEKGKGLPDVLVQGTRVLKAFVPAQCGCGRKCGCSCQSDNELMNEINSVLNKSAADASNGSAMASTATVAVDARDGGTGGDVACAPRSEGGAPQHPKSTQGSPYHTVMADLEKGSGGEGDQRQADPGNGFGEMRGLPIHRAADAWLWASSKSNTDNNELTVAVQQEERCLTFISHSWHDNWLVKVGQIRSQLLLQKYHAASFIMSVILALQILPIGFLIQGFSGSGDVGVWFMPSLCALGLGMVACFWAELCGVVFPARWGPWRWCQGTVWLDKCCIDQTSDKTKQDGIARLDEYLSRCDSVTVMLGPTYFTRLWCTYELACYCKMVLESIDNKPSEGSEKNSGTGEASEELNRLKSWVPSSTARLDDSQLRALQDKLQFVSLEWGWGTRAMWLMGFGEGMSKWEREVLTNYSCRAAECFMPGDRATVLSWIRDEWGSEEEFDLFVQREFPRILAYGKERFMLRPVTVWRETTEWLF